MLIIKYIIYTATAKRSVKSGSVPIQKSYYRFVTLFLVSLAARLPTLLTECAEHLIMIYDIYGSTFHHFQGFVFNQK